MKARRSIILPGTRVTAIPKSAPTCAKGTPRPRVTAPPNPRSAVHDPHTVPARRINEDRKDKRMKTLTLAAVLCMVAGSAVAQSPSCKTHASEKRLAGAALNSFLKKCESDAQKACD